MPEPARSNVGLSATVATAWAGAALVGATLGDAAAGVSAATGAGDDEQPASSSTNGAVSAMLRRVVTRATVRSRGGRHGVNASAVLKSRLWRQAATRIECHFLEVRDQASVSMTAVS